MQVNSIRHNGRLVAQTLWRNHVSALEDGTMAPKAGLTERKRSAALGQWLRENGKYTDVKRWQEE